MINISVPEDIAKDIAKLIRDKDDGKHEEWAELLYPLPLSERIYRIVYFYIHSGGSPRLATEEILMAISKELDKRDQ